MGLRCGSYPFAKQLVVLGLLGSSFWNGLRAAESPNFNVSIDSLVIADTVTMADSVGPGFKAHLNFPYLQQRHDGTLLATYTGGQTQSGLQFGKQAISSDGGATWIASRTIIDGGQAQLIKPSGQFSLGFSVGINSGVGINSWANSSYSSNNGGVSWFQGVSNFNTGADSYMSVGGTFGNVLEIGGTLYMPLFGQRPGSMTFENMLMVSSNQGVNWTKRSTISSFVPGPNISMGSEGPSETSIVELANGELLAVFRTGQPFPNTDVNATAPSLFFTHSSNQGQTWTTPKMLGVGGVFPLLQKLDDGSVALTYGRYGAKVMFADPTGKRWTTPETIYQGPGSGHTEMRRRSDGKYVMVYDQSGFYPPSWNCCVPSGYVFNNDNSAHLVAAVLDFENVPVVDPFPWTLEYHGDVTPDASGGGWIPTSSGLVSGYKWADLGQDYFRIDTNDSGGNNRLFYTISGATPGSAWEYVSFADGIVLETRLRSGDIGTAAGAATVFLDDGEHGFLSMKLTGGSVILEGLGGTGSQVVYSSANNPSFSPVDWHDYRLVIEPDAGQGGTITARLFLDGNFNTPILTQFLQTTFFDEIRIGDTATFNNGVMDIDYLRFALLRQMNDGDFDNNGLYNCADINALTGTIAAGTNTGSFDLTGDGLVNLLDRDAWLSEAGGINIGPGRAYKLGDANLSGAVDGSDFGIWNGSKFTSNTAWCSGNFNGDNAIDGSDFGLWNANKFTSSDGVSAVPEPSVLGGLLVALCGLSVRRRATTAT